MTTVRRAIFLSVVALSFIVPECAGAAELTGAWAPDADKCDQVFVRRGQAKQISFAEFPGVHGGGFIIDVDRLRGKHASCKIKTKKEDGQSLNLLAACATDIMLSDVQFVLRVVDDDTITRIFPGIEGMEVKYHRCRL